MNTSALYFKNNNVKLIINNILKENLYFKISNMKIFNSLIKKNNEEYINKKLCFYKKSNLPIELINKIINYEDKFNINTDLIFKSLFNKSLKEHLNDFLKGNIYFKYENMKNNLRRCNKIIFNEFIKNNIKKDRFYLNLEYTVNKSNLFMTAYNNE